jgi:hypothetical protein
LLALVGCGSAPASYDSGQVAVSSAQHVSASYVTIAPEPVIQSGSEAVPLPALTNTYKGIPVEVTGLPYQYKDICGNEELDDLIKKEYKIIATGQSSTFINFAIDKITFAFNKDGSLDLSTTYSYDQTPIEGGRFYPAQSGRVHTWHLNPSYHHHSGGDCSLDYYNDIAVSQAKLNEMRKDPSLNMVYSILLSVAEDMDYNFPAVGRQASYVTLADGKLPLVGVCEDYANLLVSRLRAENIKGVSNITKVSGQDHTWVTLLYQGKTLYLDATWFDKNNIGPDGVVDHVPQKDPREMTFDNEIFTNHGYHHIPGGTKSLGS